MGNECTEFYSWLKYFDFLKACAGMDVYKAASPITINAILDCN